MLIADYGVLFRTNSSSLTMENVPWHEDVKAFAEALAAEKGGSEYEVACEHSHSCCVLLAKSSKFKVNGKWHTWIDYEKFHDLVSSVHYNCNIIMRILQPEFCHKSICLSTYLPLLPIVDFASKYSITFREKIP